MRQNGLLMMLALLLSLTLSACQPIQAGPVAEAAAASAEQTAEEQANVALVRRVYDEVMNRNDLSVLPEIFSGDLVIHDLTEAAIPLDELVTAIPDLEATVERWVVDGDTVTALVRSTGTPQGELMGIPASGNPVSYAHIDILRVEDGKIAEIWHNIPTSDILQQMGGPNETDAAAEADLIRATELERQRAMVEADMAVADRIHADDFQIIPPFGGTLTKEQFLGDVASGVVDFLAWEPVTEIKVIQNGDMAVIRYKSFTDIVVGGNPETVHVWHTDAYEKRDGQWQIVMEQSTYAEE